MMHQTRAYDRKFLGSVTFAGLALGFLIVLPWPSAMPGSLEDVFDRIEPGMDEEEAVAVLSSCESIEGFHGDVTTTEGKSWTSCVGPVFEDMPSPQEIVHGMLSINDIEGREVEITLGPGGVVTAKRLTPGALQYWFGKAQVVFARAQTDLMTGSWWKDQVHKANRSLRRRLL